MYKKAMATAIAAGAAVTAVLTLSGKRTRNRIFKALRKDRNTNNIIIDKNVGHPDPYDVKDNTMVSEGAIYAIQRYNEEAQDNIVQKPS